MVYLLVIHFFLPLILVHITLLLLVACLESFADRCHSWLVFLPLDRSVLVTEKGRLIDLFNFIRRALFLLSILLVFFIFRVYQSVLFSDVQILLQLHLFDGLIPFVRIHLLNGEDHLAWKESIFLLVSVHHLSLLLGAAVVCMVRMKVVL